MKKTLVLCGILLSLVVLMISNAIVASANNECEEGIPIEPCDNNHQVPEFTTIGAGLVLAGASVYMYRRRSRK